MDDLTRDFASETLDALEAVEGELLRARLADRDAVYARTFRLLHTIKGTCGFLGLGKIETLAHAGEDRLSALKEVIGRPEGSLKPLLEVIDRIRLILVHVLTHGGEPEDELAGTVDEAAEPSTHVSAENLDLLQADVAELALIRTELAGAAQTIDAPALRRPLHELSHVVGLIENRVARVSRQKIASAWRPAARVAREIADAMGKSIRVELSGGETEIDRGVFSVVRETIVHLVRNAAAHGIERSAERRALGKPAEGTITLSATEQSGQVMLTVSDDGSGFHTAQADEQLRSVTHMAGRGIGLDAVRASVENAGGSIAIMSRAGQGTTFEIRLPLTVAVMQCLLVRAGGERFAIPQNVVLEIVRREPGIATASGRHGSMPMVELTAHFGLTGEVSDGYAVLCEAGERRVALGVDAVLKRESLSIKALAIGSTSPFSSAAIAADGAVVLLLDVARIAGTSGVARISESKIAKRASERSVPALEFRAGDDVLRLVPLRDVRRVCMTGAGAVNLPATVLAAHPAQAMASAERRPVLVVGDSDREVGVAVDTLGEVRVLPQALAAHGQASTPHYRKLNLAGEVAELLNPLKLMAAEGIFPRPRQQQVLLLEPDDFCREFLASQIRLAGFDILAPAPCDAPAATSFDALAELLPAMVVADLDAQWALDWIDAHRMDRHIPHRIGISARLDGVSAQRGRALGATSIIGKFDRSALKRAVAALLNTEAAA